MHEAARLLRACVNSWDGLVHAIRSEGAVRTEVLLIALATPVAFFVADTPTRVIAPIASLLLLLVVELLNTAIEKLADRVQPEIDPAIKIVKDLGSAAVTVALVIALATWGAVFWEIARSSRGSSADAAAPQRAEGPKSNMREATSFFK